MATLNRVMTDSDDDNVLIQVDSIHFFYTYSDRVHITYNVGRRNKSGSGFRVGESSVCVITGDDLTAFNAARTKNNLKSAEDYLVLKGIATV